MSYKSKEEVRSCIKQLKDKLPDVIEYNSNFNEDLYLLQFLKRHNFKVDKTESVIRESVKWRKENDIKNLANADPRQVFPGIAHERPVQYDLRTKEGQPVITFNGNEINCDAIVKQYGRKYAVRYIFSIFARIELMIMDQIHEIKRKRVEELKMRGITVNSNLDNDLEFDMLKDAKIGFILLASFKDVQIWNCKSKEILSALFEATKAGVYYFPVFATTIYIVNMTKIVTILFKFLKPIIASPCYDIQCFDEDESKWQDAVSNEISEDQLEIAFNRSKFIED